MSELNLRPLKSERRPTLRRSGGEWDPLKPSGGQEDEIEERSFVAKGAPLDDGQKRFRSQDSTARRSGWSEPQPFAEAAKSGALGTATATAIEADPSPRSG